jgi:hypothetical protein
MTKDNTALKIRLGICTAGASAGGMTAAILFSAWFKKEKHGLCHAFLNILQPACLLEI